MIQYRKRSLFFAASFVLAALASSAPAHADHYTRTSCSGGYKDPINFYWDDRHAVSTVSNVHRGTDRCGGHLSAGANCGTGQTYKYNSCGGTYSKPCTSRSNYRRYHARIFPQTFKFVPSHQDQGCRCITGQTCLGDGARFNPGRDNQHFWVIINCRSGGRYYWGNTMSISQGCGVGNQASDGWVRIVN